jgi:hypothetical protein
MRFCGWWWSEEKRTLRQARLDEIGAIFSAQKLRCRRSKGTRGFARSAFAQRRKSGNFRLYRSPATLSADFVPFNFVAQAIPGVLHPPG